MHLEDIDSSAEDSEYDDDSDAEELQDAEEYTAAIDDAPLDSEEAMGESHSISCVGSVSPGAMGRKVIASGEDGWVTMEVQCGE